MTPSKEKALAALLTCTTKQQAAEKAGISPRTLRSYLADQTFQIRLVDKVAKEQKIW